MLGLCVLRSLTVWNKSTTPSERMRSSTMHRAQKMPVLPTPSLLKERIEGTLESNISKTLTFTSARLSVGCGGGAGGRSRGEGGGPPYIYQNRRDWIRHCVCGVIRDVWGRR